MSGKRRIGRYYLLEEIGAGGMAKVFLASRPPDEKRYAVKVLQARRALDPEILARFLREIKIIARLDHPRIVKIHDHGQCDGYYYFVMDYLPGGSLSQRLPDRAGSYRRGLEIMAGVCEGLSYAHRNGVVHRDLKPGNILLDAQGAPVLADFGIAQAFVAGTGSLTRSDAVLGTINYLSPEQRESFKSVDHRTDLYAVGVILYELFTGRIPVGRFALPTEVRPGFPPALESIILRCLALDPLDRFAAAADLQQALTELLSGPSSLNDGTAPFPAADPCAAGPTQKFDPDQRTRYRLESVLNILRQGTATERFDATRRLAEVVDVSMIDVLLALLASEEGKVKWSIIKVLGGLRDARAVEPLIDALNDPFCREVAAEALGRIGDVRALPVLESLLRANGACAAFLLVPLGRLGGAQAVPVITTFLHHEYARVRECAVEALSETASAAAVPFLKACAQQDPSERVRRQARRALAGRTAGPAGVTRP